MKMSVGHAGHPEHFLSEVLIEIAAGAGIRLEGKAFDGGGEARRIASVHEGMAEVSLAMAETARWTYRAEGAYDGWRHTSLRALSAFQYPQWLGIAARWESGIGTLDDLRAARNMRLIAPLAGGASATWSFIAERVLSASGAKTAELVERGWRTEDLANAQQRVEHGDFDLLVAPLGAPGSLYAHVWHTASIVANLRFLAMPDTLLAEFESQYGLHRAALPARYVRGVETPLSTLFFPDWVIVASERLEDEVAMALSRAFEARRDALLPLHASLDPLRSLDGFGLPVHRAVKRDRQVREAIMSDRSAGPVTGKQSTQSP